jgi:hypothetical protein
MLGLLTGRLHYANSLELCLEAIEAQHRAYTTALRGCSPGLDGHKERD